MMRLSLILAACLPLSTSAFVAPARHVALKTTTVLNDVSTGFDNFCVENDSNEAVDAESARKYRRTVYTHGDWVKHRQQDRFLIYMGSLFSSGVYQNQKQEVLLATSLAALVCVWNALVHGYTDFSGVAHGAVIGGGALQEIGLPLSPFTLSGSSLGLLLSKLLVYLLLVLELRICSFLKYVLTWYGTCSLVIPLRFDPIQSNVMQSLSSQHLLQTLGRSPKELGNEYQSHS